MSLDLISLSWTSQVFRDLQEDCQIIARLANYLPSFDDRNVILASEVTAGEERRALGVCEMQEWISSLFDDSLPLLSLARKRWLRALIVIESLVRADRLWVQISLSKLRVNRRHQEGLV